MKAYGFGTVVVTVNRVPIDGFAGGDDCVSTEKSVVNISAVVGASGEMMANISADQSGKITLKLLKTSTSNKYLTGLLKRQNLAIANGVLPGLTVRVQDIARNDIVIMQPAFIEKTPSNAFGEKGKEREWVFIGQNFFEDDGAGAPVLPS